MSFNEDSDTVLYRGEHFHPPLARNFDVKDPLEWIARVTAHIQRKLAFKTPNEVFFNTIERLTVALRT